VCLTFGQARAAAASKLTRPELRDGEKELLAIKSIRTISFAAKQIPQRRVSYFLLLH
jgi:hypothetical protein